MDVSSEYLIDIVDRAMAEDVEDGDITTISTVRPDVHGHAMIVAKQDGVISGLDAAALVFYQLDADSEFITDLFEGSPITRGQEVITIKGTLAALLTGERTALNFLMHLSGIATLTSRFVAQVNHTSCQILDTRKTMPGLRLLEKRAVASGGGFNHRLGLFDMILIKNNHVDAAGSVEKAIQRAVEYKTRQGLADIKIEVETRTFDEVKRAVHLPVDRIMLDNFTVLDCAKAVQIIRGVKPEMEIEASGNMKLDNVRTYAETGIDFISVGAITHSADWLDMSMRIGAS
jgi:nicotinate-nucleotide pyrophosphorylase (carboxylating)